MHFFLHISKKAVPLRRKGNPRRVIATDGSVVNVELYNKIEAYVKH